MTTPSSRSSPRVRRSTLLVLLATTIVACKSKDPPVTSSETAQLVDTLAHALDQRYSYRDRRGLDWKNLVADARPEIERASSRDQVVRALLTLLAPAEDPHLSLVIDGKWTMTDQRKFEPNVSIQQIKAKVTDWKHGRCISLGQVSGFAYVLINGLENGRCDGLTKEWAKLYPLVQAAKGLVMDLRGNQGGNEVFAQEIAGYFVDKRTPYVKSEQRDPQTGAFAPAYVRSIAPTPGVTRYANPVVVLSGPLIMSSAESFLLMMRAAGATVVGGRSRGSSANPKPVELGSGITLMVPSWRALFLDGTLLEGVGVAPDIEVPVTPAEVAAQDKVMDAAVAELAKRVKN